MSVPDWAYDYGKFREFILNTLQRVDLEDQLEEIFTGLVLPDLKLVNCWSPCTWRMWLKTRLPQYSPADAYVPGEFNRAWGSSYLTFHPVITSHKCRTVGQKCKLGHTKGG